MDWIVSNFDTVLQLVVPGYLSVWAFQRLRGMRVADVDVLSLGILCVFLSTLYRTLLTSLLSLLHLNAAWVLLLSGCILGLLCGFLSVKLVESHWCVWLFNSLNFTLPEATVFQNNFHYDTILTVKVRSGEYEYIGRLSQHGGDNSDPWIVLDCVHILKNGHTIHRYTDDLEHYEKVILNTQSIQSIHVMYDKESREYPPWWDKFAKEIKDGTRKA